MSILRLKQIVEGLIAKHVSARKIKGDGIELTGIDVAADHIIQEIVRRVERGGKL